MEYKVIDFEDVSILPKTKDQLINSTLLKIEKLKESDSEQKKEIANNLLSAITWLENTKVELTELEDNKYYRIGYHHIDKNETIYNVQIWKPYVEDVDILDRIYMSSSEMDLDNDEDTLISENIVKSDK